MRRELGGRPGAGDSVGEVITEMRHFGSLWSMDLCLGAEAQSVSMDV